MKLIKFSIIALVLTISAQFANAQVHVGIRIGDPYPYRRVVYQPAPVYYPQPVYYGRPAYYPNTVVYRSGYRRAYYGRPVYYRGGGYRPVFRGRGWGHGHGWGHGRGRF